MTKSHPTTKSHSATNPHLTSHAHSHSATNPHLTSHAHSHSTTNPHLTSHAHSQSAANPSVSPAHDLPPFTTNTHFGTDGIRGDARQFTPDFLSAVLSGLISYHGNNHFRLLIAGDTRPSTATILSTLTRLAPAAGLTVTNLGILPTPAINYLLGYLAYDFAIDVTASHNPASSNGLKIFEYRDGKSEKIPLSARQAIETALASLDFSSPSSSASPDSSSPSSSDPPTSVASTSTTSVTLDPSAPAPQPSSDPALPYLAHLESYVSPLDLSSLHIALDCANGATSPLAARLFRTFGATVDTLSVATTYTDQINHLCGSTHLDSLISYVRSHSLDFGAAFDGDGDRCLLVDHTGAVVDGDKIIAILATFLHLDSLVTTVTANQGLFSWASSHNIDLVVSDVGDQNVFNLMRSRHISLGGEQCGHTILPGEPMGDGLLTALLISKSLISLHSSLHSLASAIPTTPQVSCNLPATPSEKSLLSSPPIQHLLRTFERKLSSEHGRLLVRPSGTEDLIRIMLWGDHEPALTSLLSDLSTSLVTLLHSSTSSSSPSSISSSSSTSSTSSTSPTLSTSPTPSASSNNAN